MKRVLFRAAAAIALSAGAIPAGSARAAPSTAEAPIDLMQTARYGTWGFDTAGQDTAARPGDDFFEYADGAAVKAMVIPPDRASYGSFVKLIDLSEARVHAILETAAARAGSQPTTPDGKIGAYYKAFMDEARVERLGAAPLKPELDRIRAVRSRDELTALMGLANDGFFASMVDVDIAPDEKDPNRYSVHISQSGLGLPDRDYYLKPVFAPKKAAYQAYVAQMLQLAGWSDPTGSAAAVVALESRIAEASWAREDERDPEKTYNPATAAALSTAAPGLGWRTLLTAADLGGVDDVVVVENTALPRIAAIYQQTPLETLKAWEAFHTANNAARYLSKPFVDARFAFYGVALSGQPQNQVRWKRAVAAVSDGLGEAVGEVYVAKYFPPSSKAKMEQLVADLKAAFRVRIQKLDWMSAPTKAEALKKLDGFTVRIGYPDKWRDYAALVIRDDDLAGDVRRASMFEWLRQVHRLGKPVDKGEWDLTPQTVNAYNNPNFNEVVFPAAILQPPFFDPDADAAVNFGAIGGVIGHEMTHGFDDQGRKFDDQGRLRDWWTPADAQGFEQRSTRLGAQYDTYSPISGQHVNGKLTMGENIADYGGLNLGLDAYHAYLGGRTAPVIGGFTGDQRVFLGWAQVWRGKNRDDRTRQLLVTDPHSPPKFRVNGVVRNVDGWYAAFHVMPGDTLYLAPDARARIW